MLITFIPFGIINVSAAEYALFPGQVLKVTQGAYGEYNSFSHNGQTGFYQNAFDLGGNSNYVAPFSGTITKIKTSYNAVVLQSDSKVYWANGDYDYMSVTFVHDNDISDLYVGKHINQGEVFYQPGVKDPGGYTTGTHLHICVNKGLTNGGISYFTGDTRPNEAFFLTESVSIQQTGNYSWEYTTGTHEHSYDTYVYYWGDHPHYKCYQCSCGDVKENRSEPTFIPSCEYCGSTIAEGKYYLKNTASGFYLSVADWIDRQEQNVIVDTWRCPFEIKNSSTTDGYSLQPTFSSTRMVNVYASNVTSGKNVCLWDDTGDASQRWLFERVSNGYVIRCAQAPSCVLDVRDRVDVYVETYTGAQSQIWTLEYACDTHEYSSGIVTKAATCVEAGTKEYVCTVCNNILVETLPQTNIHTYDNSCDTGCNVCGATRTITHDYANATCTAPKTCKVCGKTSGSKLGHTYVNACDTDCNRCGATRTITHDYTNATCTTPKTCRVCGVTSGSKLGHTYTSAEDVDCNVCGGLRDVSKNGWISAGGKWYFYENGTMVKKTWRKDSKGWVYLGADGYMLTNTWCTDSQGWCYVGADGYAVTNCWKRDSVGWIWLNSNGSMTKSSWVKDGGKWYFLDKNGYMVANQWRKDSKGWVYLGSSGAMLTNSWCTDSQGWCYVGADGYAVTNCWKKDSYGWIWLNANGSMTKSAWVKDGGKWYYLDGNGYMLYSTSRYIGGKTYKFNASGVCTNP